MTDDRLQEVERLRLRFGGTLTPAQLVESARRKESPFHDAFDWDDTVAAEKWRIEQARHIIRVFVTVIGTNGSGRTVRAFVALTSDREQGGGYRAMVDVMQDKELRARLLQDALDDLERFQQKYAALKELAEVFQAAWKVRKRQVTHDRASLATAR